MNPSTVRILLADDDDDCMFFKEAVEELPLTAAVTTVPDGDELLSELKKSGTSLPHLLFLDLNMPRKTGMESLLEIKQHTDWKDIPVIMYSTSLNPEVVDTLFEKGASAYIRKPGEFARLKKLIWEAITSTVLSQAPARTRGTFIIQ